MEKKTHRLLVVASTCSDTVDCTIDGAKYFIILLMGTVLLLSHSFRASWSW